MSYNLFPISHHDVAGGFLSIEELEKGAKMFQRHLDSWGWYQAVESQPKMHHIFVNGLV